MRNLCGACEAEKKYGGRSYLHICGKSNKKDDNFIEKINKGTVLSSCDNS